MLAIREVVGADADDIAKKMQRARSSYYGLESGELRQSFADIMKFAGATGACPITIMIGTFIGDEALPVDDLVNRLERGIPSSDSIGMRLVGMVGELRRRLGRHLVQVDTIAMTKAGFKSVPPIAAKTEVREEKPQRGKTKPSKPGETPDK